MAKAIKYIDGFLSETDEMTKVIALGDSGFYETDIEGSSSEWQPHPDWIDISSVNDNEINLLVSDGSTGIAFAVTTSSGTYTIDWGDGTTETSRASETPYSHQYTIGSGQSVNSGQYTVFKIRIYGATGNITRFQMKKYPGYSRVNYAPVLWAVFGTTAITTYANTFYTATAVECRELQACTIPSFASCTSTANVFQNCYSLASITLPSSWDSVTTTSQMFNSCYALTSVTLPTSWGNVTITSYMFVNCYSLVSVTLPTSWGNVTTANNMFSTCYSLNSITLPTSWGSVTTANSMFSTCYSLNSITLPTSWGSITNASYMFSTCYSLNSITLSTSWGSITDVNNMFYQCYSLSSITLPTSWGSITNATQMFYNCYSLRTINNLNYLGHQTTASDFTAFLRDAQAIEGTLTIASKLTKIGIYGLSGYLLNCTGIRLTNGANTWTGSSPQVNVSYTSLDATALNTLFGDLETISGKTINITGASGAATCDKTIATAKGWTVTG